MTRWLFLTICAVKRISAICIFLPIGLFVMPYQIFRRRGGLGGLFSLFSVREWNEMIGDGPEIATSPYRVIDSIYPNKLDELPPDCWYHAATKSIACRSIDEAVLIRLKYNGKIQRK